MAEEREASSGRRLSGVHIPLASAKQQSATISVFSVHRVKSKEVQVLNTSHDSTAGGDHPPPSYPPHPSPPHHFQTTENFIKVRTNRNAALAFVTQLTWRGSGGGGVVGTRAVHNVHSSRNARSAAPVNQIINVIQNTATGATRRLSIAARLLPCRSHRTSWCRNRHIQLHVHHNQRFNTAGGQKFASPDNMCKEN